MVTRGKTSEQVLNNLRCAYHEITNKTNEQDRSVFLDSPARSNKDCNHSLPVNKRKVILLFCIQIKQINKTKCLTVNCAHAINLLHFGFLRL